MRNSSSPVLSVARHGIVLFLPLLLAIAMGIAEGAPGAEAPVAVSSAAAMSCPGEMLSVEVRAAPGKPIVLVAVVRGPHDHHDTERHHTLPETFRVEKTPFRVDKNPKEHCEDRFYRILYRFGGKDLIAGVLDYWQWYDSSTKLDATLTNVGCSYDTGKQEFVVEADPMEMPPLPKVFQVTHYLAGKRFMIPLELEKHSLPAVKAQIKSHGGHVVSGQDGPVDVVLLPDDIDFVWTRNKAAESWMRRGAEVLWEKDFPRPCR